MRPFACRVVAEISAVVMIVEPPAPFICRRLPFFPMRRRLGQMPADAAVDQGDRAPKRRVNHRSEVVELTRRRVWT